MKSQQNYLVFGGSGGDEGKGKCLFDLAMSTNNGETAGVRFQGGNNSGHTIYLHDKKYVCKVIPIGCLLPKGIGVIGPYVLLMPWSMEPLVGNIQLARIGLREEIEALRALGKDVGQHNLFVDGRCNLVMPWHLVIEAANELSVSAIGSTASGIAPAYSFLHAKYQLRVEDCFSKQRLENSLHRIAVYLRQFKTCDNIEVYSYVDRLLEFGQWLKQNVTIVDHVGRFLYTRWSTGSSIFYEGGQGVMLDIIDGTMPYCTSSFVAVPELAGWVPPNLIRVMVKKAYETRVGSGPFPTELTDDVGNKLCQAGNEYGASTGRKRRVGWLDGAYAKHAAFVGRADYIFLTKLDVLTGFSAKICYAYAYNGDDGTRWSAQALAGAKPLYQDLPSVPDIRGIKKRNDLPLTAVNCVNKIEKVCGLKIQWLSTGPGTEEFVLL